MFNVIIEAFKPNSMEWLIVNTGRQDPGSPQFLANF